MRIKLGFLLVIIWAGTWALPVQGQTLGTLGVSTAIDSGTYFVGTHNVSGTFSTFRFGMAALKAYINTGVISGVQGVMPVYGAGNTLTASHVIDSMGLNHLYINDTVRVNGKMYITNVPASTAADSVLVIGATYHTVRAVHAPVGDATMTISWPANTYAVNHATVPEWSDTTAGYVATPTSVATAIAAGAPPTGAAGGVLGGTYPNPSLNATQNGLTAAVNLVKVGTVTQGVWHGTAVSYGYLNLTGSLALADFSATGTASSSTYLRGDNTWATPSSAPTGSAGGVLAGTYPNPNLGSAVVSNSNLVNNSVTVNGSSVALGAYVTVTAAPNAANAPQMVSVSAPGSPYVPNSSYGNVTAPLDISITGLAGSLTFSAPTGSWTFGQFLCISIKDNGSSQSLNWNAAYNAGSTTNGGALPGATIAGKVMVCLFRYYGSANYLFVGYSNGY